jgi:hypothetical protein
MMRLSVRSHCECRNSVALPQNEFRDQSGGFFEIPLDLKIDLSFISATLSGVHLFGGHQPE